MKEPVAFALGSMTVGMLPTEVKRVRVVSANMSYDEITDVKCSVNGYTFEGCFGAIDFLEWIIKLILDAINGAEEAEEDVGPTPENILPPPPLEVPSQQSMGGA